MKENVNTAVQYTEWLGPKAIPELDLLPVEEGVVFRHGMKLIAACRDENHKLSYFSAACPHLGGVVHWNTVEKSWDCPCHGSRFNMMGRVIEGPAWSDLEAVHIGLEEVREPIPRKIIPPTIPTERAREIVQ